VWLGWLLHAALTAFIPLAEARADTGRAAAWRAHTLVLKASIERQAWDGDWYRRGYFDDGTPLGAATSLECRIDSIAQSWAVISGAGDLERASMAMASVERELIRADDRIALLFAPPFDTTPLDPGYIKGYPPGIRENGGQYTHAALWSVMALAMLREGDKAARLFSFLNPINHARSRADVLRYKVEPYVVAADVYAASGHRGRGGWTWYTGSAGWMQRVGVEYILGIRKEGALLTIDPCVPRSWTDYEVAMRFGSARYDIKIVNASAVSSGVVSATLDGRAIAARPVRVALEDDGAVHVVHVTLGAEAKAPLSGDVSKQDILRGG